MNLVSKTLGKRYEIIEQVGVGGMATVYKAKDNLLNRNVAIKILKEEFSRDQEFVKRFRAEAQSAASLTHPNIVSVYDVGEEDGINYIVMELLEGDTLKDLIEKNGKLSSELTLKYASQIASALEAAHSAKIIHRDIKPQNIVLANNNSIAKVTDFGIAKMSSKDTITSNASTIGSVHYFSPEHAKGCYTDEKSDIYSLGVVMYEMATGTLPFNADSPVTVALKQISEEPVAPKEIVPSVTTRLNDIILKAMAKNTSDRYQSASELLDDIFAAINAPADDYYIKKKLSGNTQVVPIIGLRDTDTPSISDDRPSEAIGSRKAARIGKKLSEMEDEKEEKKNIDSLNETDEMKAKKKKKKIILLSIIGASVVIIGILIGMLVSNMSKGNENKLKIDTMPNLVGENYEEMKAKYEELGLTILVSKYEENAEIENGYIISQELKEGEKLETNKVEVVVSKGVKKVQMVDVVGKDYTVAKYELESIGLVPEFEFETDEKIEKNLIISQDIPKSEEIAVGTTVKIKVSSGDGKVRVIVPSVVGKTESSAKSALEKLNLKVSISYSNDTSKSDGVVLSQSIKENTEIEEKSSIELVINRLEKSKSVTIKLSSLASDIEADTVSVKVTAKVEGVTNTVHNSSHTKNNGSFDDFTVEVNGFTSANLNIYINGELMEQKTISF